eukprot:Hpha_TRINITY_DN16118_c1_g2::TRINITY_DN16118_c1_g2_i1::g.8171::m.8171
MPLPVRKAKYPAVPPPGSGIKLRSASASGMRQAVRMIAQEDGSQVRVKTTETMSSRPGPGFQLLRAAKKIRLDDANKELGIVFRLSRNPNRGNAHPVMLPKGFHWPSDRKDSMLREYRQDVFFAPAHLRDVDASACVKVEAEKCLLSWYRGSVVTDSALDATVQVPRECFPLVSAFQCFGGNVEVQFGESAHVNPDEIQESSLEKKPSTLSRSNSPSVNTARSAHSGDIGSIRTAEADADPPNVSPAVSRTAPQPSPRARATEPQNKPGGKEGVTPEQWGVQECSAPLRELSAASSLESEPCPRRDSTSWPQAVGTDRRLELEFDELSQRNESNHSHLPPRTPREVEALLRVHRDAHSVMTTSSTILTTSPPSPPRRERDDVAPHNPYDFPALPPFNTSMQSLGSAADLLEGRRPNSGRATTSQQVSPLTVSEDRLTAPQVPPLVPPLPLPLPVGAEGLVEIMESVERMTPGTGGSYGPIDSTRLRRAMVTPREVHSVYSSGADGASSPTASLRSGISPRLGTASFRSGPDALLQGIKSARDSSTQSIPSTQPPARRGLPEGGEGGRRSLSPPEQTRIRRDDSELLRAELATLKIRNEFLEKQLQESRDELVCEREEHAQRAGKVEAALSSAKRTSQQADQAAAHSAAQLQRQVDELRRALQDSEEQMGRLKAQVEGQKERLQNAHRELARRQVEISEQRAQGDALNQQISELRHRRPGTPRTPRSEGIYTDSGAEAAARRAEAAESRARQAVARAEDLEGKAAGTQTLLLEAVAESASLKAQLEVMKDERMAPLDLGPSPADAALVERAERAEKEAGELRRALQAVQQKGDDGCMEEAVLSMFDRCVDRRQADFGRKDAAADPSQLRLAVEFVLGGASGRTEAELAARLKVVWKAMEDGKREAEEDLEEAREFVEELQKRLKQDRANLERLRRSQQEITKLREELEKLRPEKRDMIASRHREAKKDSATLPPVRDVSDHHAPKSAAPAAPPAEPRWIHEEPPAKGPARLADTRASSPEELELFASDAVVPLEELTRREEGRERVEAVVLELKEEEYRVEKVTEPKEETPVLKSVGSLRIEAASVPLPEDGAGRSALRESPRALTPTRKSVSFDLSASLSQPTVPVLPLPLSPEQVRLPDDDGGDEAATTEPMARTSLSMRDSSGLESSQSGLQSSQSGLEERSGSEERSSEDKPNSDSSESSSHSELKDSSSEDEKQEEQPKTEPVPCPPLPSRSSGFSPSSKPPIVASPITSPKSEEEERPRGKEPVVAVPGWRLSAPGRREAGTRYTYSELRSSNPNRVGREAIDVTRREHYLEDREFEELFQMTREEYASLSIWKQHKLKQKVDFF